MTGKKGWIGWGGGTTQEILPEDLEPGGWLCDMKNTKPAKIRAIHDEFHLKKCEKVCIEQFKKCFNDLKKKMVTSNVPDPKKKKHFLSMTIFHIQRRLTTPEVSQCGMSIMQRNCSTKIQGMTNTRV